MAQITAEGGEAIAHQADATDEDSVKQLVGVAVERFGYVHILHNNVGASIALGDARADLMTVEAFDRSFAVNFKTACWPQAVLPIAPERRLDRQHLVAGRLGGVSAGRLQDDEGRALALTQHLAASNAATTYASTPSCQGS